MSRQQELFNAAKRIGLHVSTYAPGDGVMRYRFSFKDEDYFARNGVYTAMGITEAETFLAGFTFGMDHQAEAIGGRR